MTDTAEVTTEGSNDRSFKIKGTTECYLALSVPKSVLFVAGVFLTTVAGVSVLAGFSRTIMTAKRKDPAVFETAKAGNVALLEGGSKLAFRALGWGTLYSVVGVGAFCYGCWKLSGASNVGYKVHGIFLLQF